MTMTMAKFLVPLALLLAACSPVPAPVVMLPTDSLAAVVPDTLLLDASGRWSLALPGLSAATLTPSGSGSLTLTPAGVSLEVSSALSLPAIVSLTVQKPGQGTRTFNLFAPGPLASQPAALLEKLNAVRSVGYTCPDAFYPAVPALALNPALERGALAHALDLTLRGYFDHLSPEGLTPFERAILAGYRPSVVGEDLARGPQDAKSALTAWLGSVEHCKSVLSAQYSEVGFAVASQGSLPNVWVALLGKK